jgi:hypothetical protein
LLKGAVMRPRQPLRVIIAETGSPWFSLVSQSSDATLVLARTPEERDDAFEQRVAARVAGLGPTDIREILLVSRQRAAHGPRWTVSSLDASPARLAVCRGELRPANDGERAGHVDRERGRDVTASRS